MLLLNLSLQAQAHWTAGVCKVLRNLLLNLFRLTEPTPPEALVHLCLPHLCPALYSAQYPC